MEDGSDSQRQVRASSVPLAIRREAEEEARAAEEAEALRRHDMQIDDEEEGEDLNDLGAAMLNLNDKKVGAMCDACDADIFNEAYMCEYSKHDSYSL